MERLKEVEIDLEDKSFLEDAEFGKTQDKAMVTIKR